MHRIQNPLPRMIGYFKKFFQPVTRESYENLVHLYLHLNNTPIHYALSVGFITILMQVLIRVQIHGTQISVTGEKLPDKSPPVKS